MQFPVACFVLTLPYFMAYVSLEKLETLENDPDLRRGDIPKSNCTFQKDLDFNGILVDCRNLGLHKIIAEWMPASTTTALFDDNNIDQLFPEFFSRTPNMLHLSLRNNRLTTFSRLSALSQLEQLRILNIAQNDIGLDGIVWTEPYLENLTQLLNLNIASNGNNHGKYPDFLLQGLNNLQVLSLDTFDGNLEFGLIFKNTPYLSTLILKGNIERISNESFRTLEKIPLKALVLDDLPYLTDLQSGAFSYLKSLYTYKVSLVSLGMNILFKSLYPFQRRMFRNIEFTRTAHHSKYFFANYSILSEHTTRFITGMCIENITFIENEVYYLSLGSSVRTFWSHCLKHLVVRLNPLFPDGSTMFYLLSSLRSVKTLILSDSKYSLFNPHKNSNPWAFEDNVLGSRGDIFYIYTQINDSRKISVRHKDAGNIKVIAETTNQRKPRQEDNNHSVTYDLGLSVELIFLPPSLTVLQLYGLSHHAMTFDKDFRVNSGNKLIELIMKDNGIMFYSGRLLGLQHLEILDCSRNNAWNIALSFFDYFPRLRILNISNFNLNPFLISSKSKQMFQFLTQLQILDVSKNSLWKFSYNTFDTLSNLTTLILAWNRFEDIPINLLFLHKLQTLDLRENSINVLSDSSRQSLDNHVGKNGSHLTLKLEGNIMSCRCADIRFLAWIRRTHVMLDNNGNYTCMDEYGHISFTSSVGNLEAMWRKCQGWNSFMISLFVTCLIMLGFSVVFLCIKFKTRFVAYFISMTQVIYGPSNYPIGVFIGYAESDATFVRFLVAAYIEEQLGLTTYIHHRDLDLGVSIADSIVQSVESSWRVLIVVSHNFLAIEPWAWFIMQTAIFSVQNRNPGRVVVIVDEPIVHHIPHCLLTAVHEENIINIENRDRLSYEESQRLRDALRA